MNDHPSVKLWGVSATTNKRDTSRTLENIYFSYLGFNMTLLLKKQKRSYMLVTHIETGIKGVESVSPLTFITVRQEEKQMLLLAVLPTVFP